MRRGVAVQVGQERPDFGAREDGGQALGPLGPLHVRDPGQVHVEHVAVEEQDRVEGHVLCGGGHVVLDGQMGQVGAHLIRSEAGGVNLRYRTGWKGRWLARFQALLAQHMPYCRVRYAF